MQKITILDCYTDEPSGLGVPPYLGTYPRYLAGYFYKKGYAIDYMTIDDLRTHFFKTNKKSRKTNIKQYNFTKNGDFPSGKVIAIVGVHTPGKYLSALPGTLLELRKFGIKDLIITGPAIHGTQLEGGKYFEKRGEFNFEEYKLSYKEIKEYSVLGTKILDQILDERIIEIETGRGCNVGKCAFCTEPIKDRFENRPKEDIIEEIGQFYKKGARYFRLGKQTDFYVIDDPIWILKNIREKFQDIKVLHIDNVNPNSVVMDEVKNKCEITKSIVKYCTSGNIGAFGVESFDKEVIKKSSLNSTPETVYRAVKIINKYGSEVGENGMPKYLPGLNIILGLAGESKKTLIENFDWLKRYLDENLLIRRINIRQLSIFPGTKMENIGYKYLRKNKKHYYSFRDKIRKEIDYPMLEKVIPPGRVLNEVKMEIHDGNTTFGRQFGTYPIIVGVKEKLELKKHYNVKIVSNMLRSVTGEIV